VPIEEIPEEQIVRKIDFLNQKPAFYFIKTNAKNIQ
jgi:hypothetical protein